MSEQQWWPSAEEIHVMEQQWPTADAKLDEQLERLRQGIPNLEQEIGLTGGSVLFAYMRGFLLQSRLVHGLGAVEATEIMCAAAFTRLARATGAEDDMSQFEYESEVNPNDHN
jgi:hypothetical protein